MDSVIAMLPALQDLDLMLCPDHGVAFQRDMNQRVVYDAEYFAKCESYVGQEIARKINAGRIEIVARHFSPIGRVLDVGIGAGEFISNRPNTWGYDVNPKASAWLHERRRWVDLADFHRFWAFTFWDVLEHVPRPDDYFERMATGSFLFTSLPIFPNLLRIRESRHYRPGEHLYYFTDEGFVRWMDRHGFAFRERASFETDAGRDSIGSYAFQKVA